MMKQVKARINTRPQYGCKIDGDLIEIPAYFVAGDWSVVKNYNPRGYAPYIINHNSTGLNVGCFVTIKAAKACVKELATLPCDSAIDKNGILTWPTLEQQKPAIMDAVMRHTDLPRWTR
jgi:hypothetical protein